MNYQNRASGDESPAPFGRKKKKRSGLILVPFKEAELTSHIFEPALQRAEETASELVLLCVRSPGETMWYHKEDEHLISCLRALQAKLQRRSVRARIETVVGPVAQFILDYADRYEVDMIMIPESSKLNGGSQMSGLLPA